MTAPKLVTMVVSAAILASFSYVAWTLRQVAKAQAEVSGEGERRMTRTERAIQETEQYLTRRRQ